jgi:hypothetical protein
MRKKYLYVLICFLVSTLATANAVNRTITGVVISGEDNEPLIGASVYVNADDLKKAGVSQTSLGTITDMDGKFSISIPEKVTRLHCSYIGFEEQNIVLQAGKDTYRIVLQASSHTLGDVVVTGYQELERRKLTAAIAKVDVTDGMVGAAKSIDQALAGQVGGSRYDNFRRTGSSCTYSYSWYSFIEWNTRPVMGIGWNTFGGD